MNRRDFLRQALAAAGAALSSESFAGERAPLEASAASALERLAEEKRRAAQSLAHSIPKAPELQYLRDYIPHLEQESQMYTPTPEEIRDVEQKGAAALRELGAKIAPDKYGLFVFADAHEGVQSQRLYVMQKQADGALRFVKAYPVSAALRGFGNENDSNKTPLGLHTIGEKRIGLFGEVVSGLNKHRDLFRHVRVNGTDHWFVQSLGGEGGNDIAEVVTDEYLLVGPHTSPERGIRIHGTNRSGHVLPDGTWESFLGGRSKRSGGCIRMSNTDIRDLRMSGYLTDATIAQTPVSIFATEDAQRAILAPGDPALKTYPRHWDDPAVEK